MVLKQMLVSYIWKEKSQSNRKKGKTDFKKKWVKKVGHVVFYFFLVVLEFESWQTFFPNAHFRAACPFVFPSLGAFTPPRSMNLGLQTRPK
jgi:hypothetical protein